MSSTNVHSELENIQIVGGQTIPTKDNEIEIPPKGVGKGPSTLDVRQGVSMEISVGASRLYQDGRLVGSDGTLVAKFGGETFTTIVSKNNKVKSSERSASSKGEDR